MNKKMLIVWLILLACTLAKSHQLIDIEMGLSSYVGGYYYLNNNKKDFEYKSNHNWYLEISRSYNDKIHSSAELRYYPELFDKKLYLYSAKVYYESAGSFDFGWEFDRIGLGSTNRIFQNTLSDIRSDQNFITDYRFNGAVLTHKLSQDFFISYRAGGNDLNTGIGALDIAYNKSLFTFKQSFLVISRDNRFNAQALNVNNLFCWETRNFFLQNMMHLSFTDYYRKKSDEKSNVFKNLIETRILLIPFLQPQLSFYYEVENWNKYKIYEVNSIINILWNKYEISPAFKFVNYQDSLQREYSLLINYSLYPKWDVGLYSKYFPTPNNQDIISYGLQTKFNFPITSDNLKSIID